MPAAARSGGQGIAEKEDRPWRFPALAAWPRMRVLAWCGEVLYASRGYQLLAARIATGEDGRWPEWAPVASFRPAAWRRLTAATRLTHRLCRDGFHALAVLESGYLVAVLPGAIAAAAPGAGELRVTHHVDRGTRPLALASTTEGAIFWGEYFDNAGRDEVRIYGSGDRGETWSVVHVFPKGAIRHVHNVVWDGWRRCLWVLTGDEGPECRILRASPDWKHVDTVRAGDQQARCVALVPTAEAVYFASDTPVEQNYVYRLDDSGRLDRLAPIGGSSFHGCRVGHTLFFSTAVEPSAVNVDGMVRVYGSRDGERWESVLEWRKDRWPIGLFQYGDAAFPTGENRSDLLAVSTVAVETADLEMGLWRVVANDRGS